MMRLRRQDAREGSSSPIHNTYRRSCELSITYRMDLKHLRAFVSVADLGTVSKAATRLHTTQPAVSRQVMDLEGELGIALFDRVGQRLHLTGEGEQFLQSCRTMLAYASSLTEQARELRRGDSGVLKVTASPQMIDNVFSTFLRRYAKRYPNVQVRFIEGVGSEVLTLVERGEALLGTVGHEAVTPGKSSVWEPSAVRCHVFCRLQCSVRARA